MSSDAESPNGVEFTQLALVGFSFPNDLDDDKANFRFVVDVRYIDEKGNLATHHAVMPSPDTYWECDKRKQESPNYVRAANRPAFDMTGAGRIDSWDRLVFLGRAQVIHSVQVKVYDVDRQDFWDKIQDALASVIAPLLGKSKSFVPAGQDGSLQSSVSGVFGSFVDDVSSSVLKRLSNGDDVLFRGSSPSRDESGLPQEPKIAGRGTKGNYEVILERSKVTIPPQTGD